MRWVVPSLWLTGIGWYFAVCVVGGILLGRWVDGLLGSEPAFSLVGTFLGLAAALYGGYRLLTDRVLAPRQPPRPPEGKP